MPATSARNRVARTRPGIGPDRSGARGPRHERGERDQSNGSIGAWVGSGSSDGGSWHHKGSGVACTYVVPPGAPDEIIRDFDGVTNFLYFRECTDGTLDPVWVPQLSGRDLATLASDEIHKRLPAPTVGLAPAVDRGVVQVGTWIWTDPATWQPITATASIPGLAATVTARPLRLRFDPGDGVYGTGPITCDGPGQEGEPSMATSSRARACTPTDTPPAWPLRAGGRHRCRSTGRSPSRSATAAAAASAP